MKLCLVSDTHGNTTTISKMVSYLTHNPVDQIIHLGDDYSDGEAFISADLPLIRIPGTWTVEYRNTLIENRRFEVFKGWRFFLTHTPDAHYNDLPEDPNPDTITAASCDVLCHGHTHRPEVIELDGIIRVNPGHLKRDTDRGYAASFAELTLSPKSLEITHISYATLTPFMQHQFQR